MSPILGQDNVIEFLNFIIVLGSWKLIPFQATFIVEYSARNSVGFFFIYIRQIKKLLNKPQ